MTVAIRALTSTVRYGLSACTGHIQGKNVVSEPSHRRVSASNIFLQSEQVLCLNSYCLAAALPTSATDGAMSIELRRPPLMDSGAMEDMEKRRVCSWAWSLRMASASSIASFQLISSRFAGEGESPMGICSPLSVIPPNGGLGDRGDCDEVLLSGFRRCRLRAPGPLTRRGDVDGDGRDGVGDGHWQPGSEPLRSHRGRAGELPGEGLLVAAAVPARGLAAGLVSPATPWQCLSRLHASKSGAARGV